MAAKRQRTLASAQPSTACAPTPAELAHKRPHDMAPLKGRRRFVADLEDAAAAGIEAHGLSVLGEYFPRRRCACDADGVRQISPVATTRAPSCAKWSSRWGANASWRSPCSSPVRVCAPSLPPPSLTRPQTPPSTRAATAGYALPRTRTSLPTSWTSSRAHPTPDRAQSSRW